MTLEKYTDMLYRFVLSVFCSQENSALSNIARYNDVEFNLTPNTLHPSMQRDVGPCAECGRMLCNPATLLHAVRARNAEAKYYSSVCSQKKSGQRARKVLYLRAAQSASTAGPYARKPDPVQQVPVSNSTAQPPRERGREGRNSHEIHERSTIKNA